MEGRLGSGQIALDKTEPNDGTRQQRSTQSTDTTITMDVHSNTGLRKRHATEDSTSVVSTSDARERIAAVKKRISEHKHLRLKSIKEKHAEHVAEWFFLQSGGNLMDYQVWRKKPQTPELINFMQTHKLEPSSDDGGSQMIMVRMGGLLQILFA